MTFSELNVIDGTAVFEVEGLDNPDQNGIIMEGISRGASCPARAVEFEIAFQR